VLDLDELFAAAETLGRVRPFSGKRLAILTNGGGIGVLAVDRFIDLGGTLAGISRETMARLDAALPPIWSRANPVDIAGDADAARYSAALEALLEDHENDAILVMNVPTALASAQDAAKSVADAARAYSNSLLRPKPIFAVWVGSSEATTPVFEAARIPSYATESDAVRGFMHLVHYREALAALMATPPSLPQDFEPDLAPPRARSSKTRCKADAPGSIRSRARGCSRPIRFRSRPRCSSAMPTKPPPHPPGSWRRDWAWWRKSSRLTSSTNPKSAASSSI
jgi:acetyltransferase